MIRKKTVWVNGCFDIFLVIGDEYKDRTIIGAENAKRIVFFPKSLHSTTEVINKIKYG